MVQKQFADALEEWKLAAGMAPGNSDVLGFEGVTLDQLGRHEEARAVYRTALRLRPTNVEARSNLAYNLVTSGRPTEALREFDAAVRIRPNDAPLHLGRGLLQFELGNAQAACGDFLRARPWPADGPTLWTIFGACLHSKQLAPTLAAANLMPHEDAAQLEIGAALLRSGHPAEASAFLDRVEEPQPLRTQARLLMAEGWIASSDFTRAVRALEELPASFDVLELRATALIEGKRRAEAQAVLSRLLELYPENPSAYIAGTQLLLEDRRFEDVLAILNSGLERLPDNWLLLLRRAVTQKLRGAYGPAREDLTNALANDGDPALIIAALGDVLAAEGSPGGAAALFRKTLHATHQPEFQLAYALALSQQGDFSNALPEAARAVSVLPSSARAHYEYGKMLRHAGNVDQALVEFERCRKLSPHYAANLYALGHLYRELGEHKKAQLVTAEFLLIKRPPNQLANDRSW